MYKLKICVNKLKHSAIYQFYKDKQGVYSIMTAFFAFVLIGLTALAVDGSGMMLDKARFTQGIEQAGLALIAENNKTRTNTDHNDITRQNVTKEEEDTFGSKAAAQQESRNQELIRGLVRTYYYPSTYRDNKNKEIADTYRYQCDNIVGNDGRRLKTVACEIDGEFQRPSWLYLGEDTLSFAKETKIAADTIYVQKNLDEVVPIDLVLVSDLTGSMKEVAPGTTTQKITSLRNVVKIVSEELLDREQTEDGRLISPHNRISFVNFAFGAQQRNNATQCYLPFSIKSGNKNQEWIDYYINAGNNTLYYARDTFVKLLNDSVDYDKTVNLISSYNGTYRRDGTFFNKNFLCLGNNDANTTSRWFNKDEATLLSSAFNRITPNGATLSSSGLLVGANLILDKNTDAKAEPKKLNANTQRILLVLSDGRDEIYKNASIPLNVTPNLIDAGMCEAIKKKVDALQDSEIATQTTRIGFVAFGYGPEGKQKEAWQKCVGSHYYVANNEKELLESFRKIIGLVEEVGHSINDRPNYYKSK